MTARSKWVGRAKEYLTYQEKLAWEFFAVPDQPRYPTGKVALTCGIYVKGNRGDLKNYLAGVEDALQHGGIVKNDSQIVGYKECWLHRGQQVGKIVVELNRVREGG